MIWLYEKLESRMQKPECTSVLHYSMFYTFCSVFCPALNLFLFLIVYPSVTLDEEFFFLIVCDIFFPWQRYYNENFVQLNTIFKSTYNLPAHHDQELTQVTAAWLSASSIDITVNIQAHLAAQRLYVPTFGNMISVPFCSVTLSLRSWYI
jgi:hypothetical protein